jgi:hypothetical protein
MSTLINSLQRFNRKERYWLLQNTLNAESMHLSSKFREALQEETGIFIPEDAWWAMDYHLDWLIGALYLYNGGQANDPQSNPGQSLVKGTQEDIDMIIAFENTIILLEAKGDTSWGNGQLNSKIDRLLTIFDEKNKFIDNVIFRLVLMSPRKSEGLKREDENDKKWPNWMAGEDEKPFWIQLKMPLTDSTEPFFKVVRCNDDLKPCKKGDFWKIA